MIIPVIPKMFEAEGIRVVKLFLQSGEGMQ
jgi:hypothetical protein